MQRYRDYEGLAARDRGAAVAIGNFDGVHLGHQSVLALARAAAADLDAPLGVVTFEPHPRAHFDPDCPPFRLMNAEARARRFEKLGVARLYELRFDACLAAMTAEGFVGQVLADGLGIRHLVAGADFRFGKGRAGDAALLRRLGPGLGFGVTIAPLVADRGDDVSSTAIRQALSEGRPRDAARMLGHWHRIEGRVEHGEARGRDLGYPTANVDMAGLHLPLFGVYAVGVDVLGGPHAGRYGGAASIGVRPTFGENRPNLEVHLLDFAGDLYGVPLSVALIAFQRPETRFASAGALVARMQADVAEARRHLAEASGPDGRPQPRWLA
ncbi:bifunctional riboflavin kinase/FAD synthetase [soil metagenome]